MYEIWHFLAGLGLFLYGISRIERALHRLGGRKFVHALRRHTKNPIESVASGTVLTALLQSSSLVSLMVLAFVGSQFIPMPNALGIIMGANLGTTFTGWIVAIFGFKLDIEHYSLPIIALGALGLTFINDKKRARSVSQFVFGFGLLLFGLGFMKSGMESIADSVDISVYQQYGIVHFFILGIVVTAIIQSSSAMMAITLSALSVETISLQQAAATVIGADLGTTITVILGSLSGASAKKQVAYFHVLFNLIVDLLSLLCLPLLLYFIVDIVGVTDPLFSLVFFHNTFNAIGIFVFLPFLSLIAAHIQRIFKEKSGSEALYLKTADQHLPTIPLDAIKLEIEHMAVQVIKYNMQVLQLENDLQALILKDYSHYVKTVMSKRERYEFIKRLESEIIAFSLNLNHNELSKEETSNLALWTAAVRNLVHSARSIKSIRHDLANIVRMDDEKSYENRNELIKRTQDLYKSTIKLLSQKDQDAIFEELSDLEHINEQTHDQLVIYVYKTYAQNVSTPLNVMREIYSSNKALINALKEYKLNYENLTTFENLPMLVR